ncbi:hypothetical protein QYM36_007886, partial [Artemia franciscana]
MEIESTRKEYNRARNKVREETRQVKKEQERKIAGNAKSAPKKFRKHKNAKLATRREIPTLFNKDGSSASSQSERANNFNHFFSS